ncbi:MAG: hypothetical protein JNK11_19455 [Alphaproteobacteria bacterium]|nr:hypothetical protein [Alphaproteobacteria bacterium]
MQMDIAPKQKSPITERMKAAFAKTLHAARAPRRFGRRRGAPGQQPALSAVQPISEGEVQMVALALERLAPATGRAGLYGVPVTVRVPDERTASVFRAALAKSQQNRSTDRLIEIRVTDG